MPYAPITFNGHQLGTGDILNSAGFYGGASGGSLAAVATSGSYTDLSNRPTKLSQLTNDLTAVGGNFAVPGTLAVTGLATTSAGISIPGSNIINFGSDQAKASNSGSIGYQSVTSGSLDIFGAGTSTGSRGVKLWDNVIVPGTLGVTGAVTTGGLTASTLGTGGNLSMTGTANTGALTAASVTTAGAASTGALTATSLSTGGNLSVTGTASTGALTASSLSTGGNLSVTGTANTGALTASSLSTGGNLSVTGTANTGALTAASVTTAGAASTGALTATSLNTGGNLSVSGTANTGALTAASITTAGAASTGALTATSLSTGGNLSVTGTANTGALTAASVTTAGTTRLTGPLSVSSSSISLDASAGSSNLTYYAPPTLSHIWGLGSSNAILFNAGGGFYPSVDNTISLGTASQRWKSLSLAGPLTTTGSGAPYTGLLVSNTGGGGSWTAAGAAIDFRGYTASTSYSARIRSSDAATGNYGGTLQFFTKAANGADTDSLALRMVLDETGKLNLMGPLSATTGIISGPLAVGSSTAASYPLDVTGQLRVLNNGANGIIVKNPNTTNDSSACEINFDRSAAGSTLVSAQGMSGTARGAYWWVNGTDCINISPATGAVIVANSLSVVGPSSTNSQLNTTGNTVVGSPTMAVNGGAADRVVLWPGTSTSYPYSLGMNSSTMWYSVPGGSFHQLLVNNTEVMRVTAGGVSQTGLISWPVSGASSGMTWGPGPYSKIVDDGDLRICTDDNMHIHCGLTSSSNGTEVMTMTNSAITNRVQVAVTGSNVVNFGSDVSKTGSAGNIGYQTYTPGALDIVGAGTANNQRNIKLWDNVTIPGTLTCGNKYQIHCYSPSQFGLTGGTAACTPQNYSSVYVCTNSTGYTTAQNGVFNGSGYWVCPASGVWSLQFAALFANSASNQTWFTSQTGGSDNSANGLYGNFNQRLGMQTASISTYLASITCQYFVQNETVAPVAWSSANNTIGSGNNSNGLCFNATLVQLMP